MSNAIQTGWMVYLALWSGQGDVIFAMIYCSSGVVIHGMCVCAVDDDKLVWLLNVVTH